MAWVEAEEHPIYNQLGAASKLLVAMQNVIMTFSFYTHPPTLKTSNMAAHIYTGTLPVSILIPVGYRYGIKTEATVLHTVYYELQYQYLQPTVLVPFIPVSL